VLFEPHIALAPPEHVGVSLDVPAPSCEEKGGGLHGSTDWWKGLYLTLE
jgi:hypothetical protein